MGQYTRSHDPLAIVSSHFTASPTPVRATAGYNHGAAAGDEKGVTILHTPGGGPGMARS